MYIKKMDTTLKITGINIDDFQYWFYESIDP